MKDKINVAELLKDCPKGMELDCTMFENTYFDYVDVENNLILCYSIDDDIKIGLTFSKYGTYSTIKQSKCVIFPKGKTSWEGFQKPFEDGDIVTRKDRGSLIAFIYKERRNAAVVKYHFALYTGGVGTFTDGEICLAERELVFATEEEKAELFDAIKANGYKWNSETKTLEKLVQPKFKVGDKIRHKTTNKNDIYEISKVYDDSYGLVGFTWMIYMKYQDYYELVPNKFDINTLVPFESRVLVRNDESQYWIPAFWGCKRSDGYTTTFGWCKYCIPFEGNKHLLGTNNDCDEYFKTWK